jgi:hypothetical protein
MALPSSWPRDLAQERTSDRARLFLVFLIASVLIISWTGILDGISAEFLNDSFINAIATYGSARLINGIISVLQTTTIEAGAFFVGGSLSIGQMLDPINDAVERLSNVMTIAIGSILLQKTLLAITSSLLFKVLLTLSGLGLAISSFIKDAPYMQMLSKLFVFLVFIRLSLGFMLLLNLAVDQSYLSGQINNNQKEMKTLASRVDGEIAENNEKIAQEIEKLSIQEDSKGAELALLLHEEQDLSSLVSTKENELEKARSKLGLADRYFDPSLDRIKESLSERKSTLKKKTNQIEGIQKGLKTIGEDISSKEEAISDSGTISIATARKVLSGSAKYFKNQVEVLLDMMILFMMKTVIFPLLFMYLLTKGFKLIWGVDVRTLIKREQKI